MLTKDDLKTALETMEVQEILVFLAQIFEEKKGKKNKRITAIIDEAISSLDSEGL